LNSEPIRLTFDAQQGGLGAKYNPFVDVVGCVALLAQQVRSDHTVGYALRRERREHQLLHRVVVYTGNHCEFLTCLIIPESDGAAMKLAAPFRFGEA